jgi:hypothetical protein
MYSESVSVSFVFSLPQASADNYTFSSTQYHKEQAPAIAAVIMFFPARAQLPEQLVFLCYVN